MLNQIILQGRLVTDPYLQSGLGVDTIGSFCLACDRDLEYQDGTTDTDFVDCIAVQQTSEFIGDHFHKGDVVFVSGQLQIWDLSLDGITVSIAIVRVFRIDLCQPEMSSHQSRPELRDCTQENCQQQKPCNPPTCTDPQKHNEDDDLPF